MMGWLAVMAGGALGAGARYGVALAWPARGFPWATLAVNLLGGLFMGLLMARAPAESARLLLGVGVLGGFTTFSAFGLETWRMLAGEQWGSALAYVLVSIVGAVALTGLGLRLR